MGLKTNLARFRIHHLQNSDLPATALAAIEEGYDSPSLLILAGKPADEISSLLLYYFHAALCELGLSIPEQDAAILEVGIDLAQRLLSGETDFFNDVWNLINVLGLQDISTARYGFDETQSRRFQDHYYILEDLQYDDGDWQYGNKSREIATAETREALQEMLQQWLSRHSS